MTFNLADFVMMTGSFLRNCVTALPAVSFCKTIKTCHLALTTWRSTDIKAQCLPTVFNQPVQKQKWQGQQQENLLHRDNQSQRPDGKPNVGVNKEHGQQASTQHRQANRFINHWRLCHG
jgi:hypothetical protein